jgi:hypothetical protein
MPVANFAADWRDERDTSLEEPVQMFEREEDDSYRQPNSRRFPPFLIVAAVVFLGAGVALAWFTYNSPAPSANEAPTQSAAGPSEAVASTNDLESLRATIIQLATSQQQMAETIAALQADLREIRQGMALRQADIQRLSNAVSSLVSKSETARKPATKPTPAAQEAQHGSGGENAPANQVTRGATPSRPSGPAPLPQQ